MSGMCYRRACVPAGTRFFYGESCRPFEPAAGRACGYLRDVMREVKRRHSFEVVAWVALPEHMHAV